MATLSINENTLRKRQVEQLRKDLLDAAKRLGDAREISGFAVVAWDDTYASACQWNSEYSALPGLVVPEFVKKVLERDIQFQDLEDAIDTL